MKNKRFAVILLSLFLVIRPCSFGQNIFDGTSWEEEWVEEWLRIIEQAENYRIMEQEKIRTLDDLRFTYWVPVDRIDEIQWTYAFLNEDFVLLFNSYDQIVPRSLIRYTIRDNIIFFAEYLKCYLDDTYLFIGDEKKGYVRYKLLSTFSFIDEVF